MKQLFALPVILTTLAISSATMAEDNMKGSERYAGHFKEKLAGLPEDKQQLVMDSFKAGREEGKPSREAMKTKYHELRAIATAETFDRDAYLKKSAELRTLKNEMQAKRAERKADLLSKLTAEERKILAEAKKGHGSHGKHRKDDGAEHD